MAIIFFGFFVTSKVMASNEAMISNSFKTTINSLDNDPNNTDEVIINGATGWKWLYNSNTASSSSGFAQFGQVEATNSSYISLSTSGELNNGYGYQCVGFVKAASDELRWITTSNWIKGTRVSSNNLPSPGTIIATFGSDGKYDFGHAAIYINKIGNYIYVLDQNWDGTGQNPVGKIYLHAIAFTGNGGLSDANSYYRVEVY